MQTCDILTDRQIGRVHIIIKTVYDEDGYSSLDWLGQFSNYREPQTENQKLVHRSTGRVLDHTGIWRDSRGRIVETPEENRYANEMQNTWHNNGHEKIKYALQDSKRLEDFENGYWSMLGTVATVYVNGKELGRASVWGTESDSDESHFMELGRECLHEALAEAKTFIGELCRA